MKTATGHEEENLKLYALQYSIGRNTGVEHAIALNDKIALRDIMKSWDEKYPNIWVKPKFLSIQEVTHPDYNINLERKLK